MSLIKTNSAPSPKCTSPPRCHALLLHGQFSPLPLLSSTGLAPPGGAAPRLCSPGSVTRWPTSVPVSAGPSLSSFPRSSHLLSCHKGDSNRAPQPRHLTRKRCSADIKDMRLRSCRSGLRLGNPPARAPPAPWCARADPAMLCLPLAERTRLGGFPPRRRLPQLGRKLTNLARIKYLVTR